MSRIILCSAEFNMKKFYNLEACYKLSPINDYWKKCTTVETRRVEVIMTYKGVLGLWHYFCTGGLFRCEGFVMKILYTY